MVIGHLYIFFEEMSIQVCLFFLIGLSVDLLSCRSFYIFCILNSYHIYDFKYSHSVGCLFTFLRPFDAWRFLMKSNLFFSFVSYTFGVIYKNALPNPRLWRFTPMISSKCFMVLALILKSLICFELIFVCGMR